MLIYKILTADVWTALRRDGESAGAPVDLEDGYIHFSTSDQVRDTAAKHFAGQDGLVLAAVETGGLGEVLKWEPARGGALFPHLYRRLRLADIAWTAPLPLESGVHRFPATP